MMIEMRQDPTTRNWILIGQSGQATPPDPPSELCPFCPGNEAHTPPSVAVITGSDGLWRVRAFPDKRPVFQVEGDLDRAGEGLYDRMRNVGAHEVVVETREHAVTLPHLSVEDVSCVLQMFRTRIRDLKNDLRLRYIQIFKNQGRLAGSRISHAHAHLVATPVLPRRLEAELRWSKQHYDLKERCLYCDMIRQELEQGARLVERTGDFVAFCPFAPRFAFETWLFPVSHAHRFEDQDDAALLRLAAIFRRTLARVEQMLPDHSVVLHTAPNEQSPPIWGLPWESLPLDFHWHIEILPRRAEVARLHREEEFYVNPVPPEEAAERLRGVLVD